VLAQEPYAVGFAIPGDPAARGHASVRLMIGKNRPSSHDDMATARRHGHSPTTMFRTYAAWMDGAP